MDLVIKKTGLYSPLGTYVTQLESEFSLIPEARKLALQRLALFIRHQLRTGDRADLMYICTHNSRRSHIAQVWSHVVAAHYGFSKTVSYSGGTEATAFNDRALIALREVGFKIEKTTNDDNPIYEVRYSDEAGPVKAYSKVFQAAGNPKKNFCAVMTCAQADQNCPVVPGAAERVAIPYDDPKDFDGTPDEENKYRESVRQIGREILYAFSLVGHQ